MQTLFQKCDLCAAACVVCSKSLTYEVSFELGCFICRKQCSSLDLWTDPTRHEYWEQMHIYSRDLSYFVDGETPNPWSLQLWNILCVASVHSEPQRPWIWCLSDTHWTLCLVSMWPLLSQRVKSLVQTIYTHMWGFNSRQFHRFSWNLSLLCVCVCLLCFSLWLMPRSMMLYWSTQTLACFCNLLLGCCKNMNYVNYTPNSLL